MKTSSSGRSCRRIGLVGLVVMLLMNVVALFVLRRPDAVPSSDAWWAAWWPGYLLWIVLLIVGFSTRARALGGEENVPVPSERKSIGRELAVVASVPAVVGLIAWTGSWHSDNAQVVRGMEMLFVVMLWVGPFSGIAAIVLAARSGVVRWKWVACLVINGMWVVISLWVMGWYFWVRR